MTFLLRLGIETPGGTKCPHLTKLPALRGVNEVLGFGPARHLVFIAQFSGNSEL